MNEADIQRINELARKSKTVEGLTEAELAEQAALRKAYIASVKRNLKAQLESGSFDKALGNLPQAQQAKLKKALSDPKTAEKMLGTPQAQEIYKKLQK